MAFDAAGGLLITPEREAGGGWVLRIAPTTKKRLPIPIAEINKHALRPKESTAKMTNTEVAITLRTP